MGSLRILLDKMSYSFIDAQDIHTGKAIARSEIPVADIND
jgi:hypothetical protein